MKESQPNRAELLEQGYTLTPFLHKDEPFALELQALIQRQDWVALDLELGKLLDQGGALRGLLNGLVDVQETEHFISIRGVDPEEEDGIWHDDGSRRLAFSFSLTLDHEAVKGGILEFRKKHQGPLHQIPTPPFGHIILFLTGVQGYEHRIRKVEAGRRIICVGWCP